MGQPASGSSILLETKTRAAIYAHSVRASWRLFLFSLFVGVWFGPAFAQESELEGAATREPNAVKTLSGPQRPQQKTSAKNDAQNFAADAPTTPVCVSSLRARLRAGPGTKFKVNWEVARYMPLERLKSQSGWSQVRDFRGEVHWVLAGNLTTEDSCAVVKVKAAALYQGPGKEHPRAEFSVADKYTPFRKTDREGEWVRVEDDFKGVFWTLDSNLWIPVQKTSLTF